MGHRIAKHILDADGLLEHSTYYVLDAQGNVMSIYEREVDAMLESISFYQAEKHLYGSSRLGILNSHIELLGSTNDTYDMTTTNHRIGAVNYELSNHLGNVLSTISDKPIPHDNSGVADYWLADIRSSQDYSAFGVILEDRNFTLTGAEKGRYGYQGSEKDDEMKGEGNSYSTFYRMHDPRLGRWFSTDPVTQPWQSPYNSMDNNPIGLNDPFGKSGEVTIDKETKTITVRSVFVFYGGASSMKLAKKMAKDIEDQWNAANGKVMVDGEEYKVKFSIYGRHSSNMTEEHIKENTDIKNNYIRVQTDNDQGVSYMDGVGSNTGYFVYDNVKKMGSTTEAHEVGHGWGLVKGTEDGHPKDGDLRGKGQPGIRYARGTLVDPQYQYDPKAKPGEPGGTMNPEKRKVLQSDIDLLGLGKLKYDSKGKAKLGKLTNIYHERTYSKPQ